MSTLATSLVNWSAVWKIVLVALIGGAGMVIAFGLTLVGLERAGTARSGGVRLAHRTLAGVCGLLCAGAMAIGIYAMAQKHPSQSVPKPTRAALSATPKSATN